MQSEHILTFAGFTSHLEVLIWQEEPHSEGLLQQPFCLWACSELSFLLFSLTSILTLRFLWCSLCWCVDNGLASSDSLAVPWTISYWGIPHPCLCLPQHHPHVSTACLSASLGTLLKCNLPRRPSTALFKIAAESLGGPVVKTPCFNCWGLGFNPWIRELRFHKPHSKAK